MTSTSTSRRAPRAARCARLLLPVLLLTTALASSVLVACGARQHIPLDAPRYEDPVGPADAGPAHVGSPTPRS